MGLYWVFIGFVWVYVVFFNGCIMVYGFILGFYGFLLVYIGFMWVYIGLWVFLIHQNLSLILVEEQVFLGFKHQTWRYNMILLEKNGCLMLIVD